MIWAVLDTNTLVSGFGWPGTTPARIVDQMLDGVFSAVMSRPMLDELARVLSYPKLQPVFDDPSGLVRLVESVVVMVDPTSQLSVLADDDDNRLLEAATEANADYIVSGDRRLLELGAFEGSEIVTAKSFLEILEASDVS